MLIQYYFLFLVKFLEGLYNHLLCKFLSKYQSSMTIFHYINVRVHNIGSLFNKEDGSEKTDMQVGFWTIDELKFIIHHPRQYLYSYS